MGREQLRARPSAVVFAYHNVGVRCLRVLLDGGVDVRLVVTHRDKAGEVIWFDSVAALAAEHELACIAPDAPDSPGLLELCRSAEPDFIFSFYYRHMLPAGLLGVARRGAFNVHGSLLPKYRGRAPVNWAVLRGEHETGATLHGMDAKPDHGPIVDRQAVPILGDDTAREVFDKVSVAAGIVMARTLPRLIDGTARLTDQVPGEGFYCGGRGPEDGRVPALAGAKQIHDLVRAVAPPEYPGAFFDAGDKRVSIARTRLREAGPSRASPSVATFVMRARDGELVIDAVDGASVYVLAASVDGVVFGAGRFLEVFGPEGARPNAPSRADSS